MKVLKTIIKIYAIVITVVLAVFIFNVVVKKQQYSETIQHYLSAIKDCENGYIPYIEEADKYIGTLGLRVFEGMEEARLHQIFSNGNDVDFLVKTKKEVLDDIDPNTYDYAFQMKYTSNFFIIKDKRVVNLKYYWYDNYSR